MGRKRSGTKLRVYYAHCLALYNTPQEKRDVALLRRLGFTVENPNSKKHDKGAQQLGMDYFEQFSRSCDLIAFRALPDGTLPGGVNKEIKWFQAQRKPVIELPGLVLRKVLDRHMSRIYLREVGMR